MWRTHLGIDPTSFPEGRSTWASSWSRPRCSVAASARRSRSPNESQYEYESILWVDALSEEKLAFVSGPGIDMGQLDQLMKRAYSLMLRWRSEVILWRPEPLSDLKKLDLRRLFKGHVSYLKRQSLPPGA
jgi:hypothetical protein